MLKNRGGLWENMSPTGLIVLSARGNGCSLKCSTSVKITDFKLHWNNEDKGAAEPLGARGTQRLGGRRLSTRAALNCNYMFFPAWMWGVIAVQRGELILIEPVTEREDRSLFSTLRAVCQLSSGIAGVPCVLFAGSGNRYESNLDGYLWEPERLTAADPVPKNTERNK